MKWGIKSINLKIPTILGLPSEDHTSQNLRYYYVITEIGQSEKGAFTGAEKKMRGKFEQADSGVLFLDEIGDMPLMLQSKLLHALKDGDFSPLESEKTVVTNVSVLAATNQNLEDKIEKGNFRTDLYHRLNVININIEPLRNRPEDIPHLIDHKNIPVPAKW